LACLPCELFPDMLSLLIPLANEIIWILDCLCFEANEELQQWDSNSRSALTYIKPDTNYFNYRIWCWITKKKTLSSSHLVIYNFKFESLSLLTVEISKILKI
jgi:hypothetical protein